MTSRKTRKKHFNIPVDVFDDVLHVYVGYDLPELLTRFKRLGYTVSPEDEEEDVGCNGFFDGFEHPTERPFLFLWLKSFKWSIEDISIVSHESTHAAQWMLHSGY